MSGGWQQFFSIFLENIVVDFEILRIMNVAYAWFAAQWAEAFPLLFVGRSDVFAARRFGRARTPYHGDSHRPLRNSLMSSHRIGAICWERPRKTLSFFCFFGGDV
jgi:hypothetical protein